MVLPIGMRGFADEGCRRCLARGSDQMRQRRDHTNSWKDNDWRAPPVCLPRSPHSLRGDPKNGGVRLPLEQRRAAACVDRGRSCGCYICTAGWGRDG